MFFSDKISDKESLSEVSIVNEEVDGSISCPVVDLSIYIPSS